MKNSPSAFIPFCEYNGDMEAVGEHITNFSFPVCNIFRPTVLHGQLCYSFDPNNVESHVSSDQPYIMFLLDYNEDRQLKTLVGKITDKQIEPKKLSDMEHGGDTDKQAMIYIHTLGNHCFLSLSYL